MHVISAQEAKKRLDNQSILLIDIREPYEREICYIEQSEHFPMGDVEAIKLKVQHSEKESVLICKSGKRAEATANLIEKELNIDNVYILEGGIIAWIETIEPHLELY